ncbi:MAG: class I SAM-dependent methyltransferase [Ignavibacteriales bacterium]|nr:class I SAM-dependent methyltransferase [Ignavibacteriales bacterium]
MGCGTGRILLPARRAGADIDGLDASPAMIGRLKDKAAAAGLAVRAETADMRAFEMGRRYSRIFCAFNGFAHCETIADQTACLRLVAAASRAGGRLRRPHVLSRARLLAGAGREGRPRARGRARRAAASSSCGTTAARTSSPRGRIRRSRSGSSTPRTARRPSTSSRRPSAGSIASSSSCSSPPPASPGGNSSAASTAVRCGRPTTR